MPGGTHFKVEAIVILHGSGSIHAWRKKFCPSTCIFYASPPPLPLKKKRWDFAEVEEEGHAFVCDYTLLPVRKPVLKYAWLEISIYKKKLTYHLKH